MGIPLDTVRDHNAERIAAALDGIDTDLIGVLGRIAYDKFDIWLELLPGGNAKGIANALGAAYKASLEFLRRKIAELGLPYPAPAGCGTVPENSHNDATDDAPDDSKLDFDSYFVELPSEQIAECAIVLRFVVFAVMKARDRGTRMENGPTRAWISIAFLHTTDSILASHGVRLLLELLATDSYVPPYCIMGILLENALTVPCGNSSTPTSASQTLAQFVESDIVAADVVAESVGRGSLRLTQGRLFGRDAINDVTRMRLLQVLGSSEDRVRLVELQVWSLCALFALTLAHGFDELTLSRAPTALKAVADLARAPNRAIFSPLKVAIAETLWCVLALQLDDSWPELYALRLGLGSQLASLQDAEHDYAYQQRLLLAVSMGIPRMGTFLPGLLTIATDDSSPDYIKLAAGNVMSQVVRDEEMPPGALRSQNAYALLVRELSRSAAAVPLASTDRDAQMAAGLSDVYVHLFAFWLNDNRTPELEHALINSDFFEICADLAASDLRPYLRSRTMAVAIEISTVILDPSRIEPLAERGTVKHFMRALYGIIDYDLSRLQTVADMAEKLWYRDRDSEHIDLVRHACQTMIASPWQWLEASARAAYVQLLRSSESAEQDGLLAVQRILSWIFVKDEDLPPKVRTEISVAERFRLSAASFAFEVLSEAPDLPPSLVRLLFDAAKAVNLRSAVPLQYYAAQDLEGCVSQFLLDSAASAEKASFLLAVDKVALVKTHWPSDLRRFEGRVASYDNLEAVVDSTLGAATIEAAFDEARAAVYVKALKYVLKETQFVSDFRRVQLVHSILSHCEAIYKSHPGSGNIRQLLLFLRDVTVDWKQPKNTAADIYGRILDSACHILRIAFETSDEPTQTLTFSVLNHVSDAGKQFQEGSTIEVIGPVLDAALHSSGLQARNLIPSWFGRRDEGGNLTARWREKFVEVILADPMTIFEMTKTLSDRSFARLADFFIAAGNAAVDAMSVGKVLEYVDVVAAITTRLQSPWNSFENMRWTGSLKALELGLQFIRNESTNECAYVLFGPLAALLEHAMCFALQDACERGLSLEEKLASPYTSQICSLGFEPLELVQLVKTAVERFKDMTYDEDRVGRAMTGIAWVLARYIDVWPHTAVYIIDTGLFSLLIHCTSSAFRPRVDLSPSNDTPDQDNKRTSDRDFSMRAIYRTVDPILGSVTDRTLRVIAHAISVAGVLGERKLAMLLDTPRVVGFNQIENNTDAKSLILRRPELRHVALKHVAGTRRGVVPASDTTQAEIALPPLDEAALRNISSMVTELMPAFIGGDRKMAEVAGDSLVDLVSSVGASRDVIVLQFPHFVQQVVRLYGPLDAPLDSRLRGDLRNAHIIETSTRLLSALTFQGLDEPFNQEVRRSLKRSGEAVFSGIADILKQDVLSNIEAGESDIAAFQLHFITNLLMRIFTEQNRLELSAWSQVDTTNCCPPVVEVLRASQILSGFIEAYGYLDTSTLSVRAFRAEVASMIEECLVLDGYDWPRKSAPSAALSNGDDSDENEIPPEHRHQYGDRLDQHQSLGRDVFRNSMLGDIEDEGTDEGYMDADDDDLGSEEEEVLEGDQRHPDAEEEFSGGELSEDGYSSNESEEEEQSGDDIGDRMSIIQFMSDSGDAYSSDESVFLIEGLSSDEDNSDGASPEIIETIFSSEENNAMSDFSDSRTDNSDSSGEADAGDFSDDSDLSSSDMDIVIEGSQPITGFESINGVLLRFSNDLDGPELPEFNDSDALESYAISALCTEGTLTSEIGPTVLPEDGALTAWWNDAHASANETFHEISSFVKVEAVEVPVPVAEAAIASVRSRKRNPEPALRTFNEARDMNAVGIAATLARMLFTTLIDQERLDLLQAALQLMQSRQGRDAFVHVFIDTLFEAANGAVAPRYSQICLFLRVPVKLPQESTPALVCANIVGLLHDFYEKPSLLPPSEDEEHRRICHRLSRALLRNYGSKLIDLLSMPQICQNRRLLNSCAVMVLNVLSIMDSRRFETDIEHLARVAQVLGLRECTSEAFSTLTEIIQKHLRTDALLPHVIREARRARSSLLVLLPAISKYDVEPETMDAFGIEQVKLLRLLSLLNRIYEPQQVIAAIKSVNLLPLWHKVISRLRNGTLEGTADGRRFASGVSLLESFAIALVAATNWNAHVPDAHPSITKYAGWIKSYVKSFMGQQRVLINELLRARPNLYLGPMGEMARILRLFDLQSKEQWLRAKLKEDAAQVRAEGPPELKFSVRRSHVLEDSYGAFHDLQGIALRAPMAVKFEKEEAVDAGGVSREWFEIISREILNPNYALFTPTQDGSPIYQVNRDSGINTNHLEFYRFVGRVLGRAVYDGRTVGLYFSRIIYKYMLGRPFVSLSDMETVDEQYYNSLVWMLEMDVTDVIDETFSVQRTQFGNKITVDLVEDGRNLPVTEENKQDYVKRIVEYNLVESVAAQLDALRQGFNDVINPSLVELFDEQELELLLCGLPTVSVDDWRTHTIYVGYAADSPQVRWFWAAVASFSTEERAKLLQFSTGTSRVPVNGFAHLESSNAGIQFQIHKEHGDTNRWPSSHTCMNQINLPAYESYKKLRSMVLRAVTESSEGFGFV